MKGSGWLPLTHDIHVWHALDRCVGGTPHGLAESSRMQGKNAGTVDLNTSWGPLLCTPYQTASAWLYEPRRRLPTSVLSNPRCPPSNNPDAGFIVKGSFRTGYNGLVRVS